MKAVEVKKLQGTYRADRVKASHPVLLTAIPPAPEGTNKEIAEDYHSLCEILLSEGRLTPASIPAVLDLAFWLQAADSLKKEVSQKGIIQTIETKTGDYPIQSPEYLALLKANKEIDRLYRRLNLYPPSEL